MSAPQALLGGRYRLVRRIAAGGMGIVWEGWDEVLERPVAIKQLRTEAGVSDAETERAKNRAMREARITARLHHPHAVPVFDAVKHEGQPCLIMQYVPSTTLSAVLRERGPLPPVEAARIGGQVASALAAAHRLGIVHRDVKPGNILLTEDGNALISDFGISHALGDATLTSTGLVHGTPAFLAPEVARGAQSGFPSDVFSLGSTLYAATEGAPPFGMDSNSIALLHKVAAGRFPPPVRSGALTPLLLEMLNGDPDARPSMSDVAERLESLERAVRTDPGASTATVPMPAPVPPPSEEPLAEEDESSLTGEPASEEPETPVEYDDITLLAAAFADDGTPPEEAEDESDLREPEPVQHAETDQVEEEAAVEATDDGQEPREEEPREEEPTAAAPRTRQETPRTVREAPRTKQETPPTKKEAARTKQEAPRTVEPLPWFVPAGRRPPPPPPAPAPPAPPEGRPAAATVAAEPPPAHAGRRERNRRLAGILAVAVVAALALLGGSLLVPQLGGGEVEGDARPRSTSTPRATTPTTTAPSETPSAPPSTPPPSTPAPSPTPEPTSEPPPPPPATAEERLAQAVTGYYALMPRNTDAAWPLMTADYQTNHAGGRAAYERFWADVSEVSVSDVRGIAPDAAEATITYVYSNGTVAEERTAYRFVDEGGTLKIAATDVLSSVTR